MGVRACVRACVRASGHHCHRGQSSPGSLEASPDKASLLSSPQTMKGSYEEPSCRRDEESLSLLFRGLISVGTMTGDFPHLLVKFIPKLHMDIFTKDDGP